MDIIGKIQCMIGSHKGDWVYGGTDTCVQYKACVRSGCKHIDTKTEHEDWAEWADIKEKSCIKERFCVRCKKREEELFHLNYTAWEYTSNWKCDQARQCTRCGAQETQTVHEFGSEKHYTRPDSCKMHVLCKRCNLKKDIILILIFMSLTIILNIDLDFIF